MRRLLWPVVVLAVLIWIVLVPIAEVMRRLYQATVLSIYWGLLPLAVWTWAIWFR